MMNIANKILACQEKGASSGAWQSVNGLIQEKWKGLGHASAYWQVPVNPENKKQALSHDLKKKQAD